MFLSKCAAEWQGREDTPGACATTSLVLIAAVAAAVNAKLVVAQAP
jgi:hypothetical protein